EVTGAVELADVPRRLAPDPVHRADIASVRYCRSGLLQLPEVLTQAGHGGRRIDDVFGAVQRQCAPALGKVPVVTDVDAELAISGLKHRPARVARLEEELLVEAGHLRYVRLAVFSEV